MNISNITINWREYGLYEDISFNEVCQDYFLQLSQIQFYSSIAILSATIINTFILPHIKKYIYQKKYNQMSKENKNIIDELFAFADIAIYGTYIISSLLLIYQVFI